MNSDVDVLDSLNQSLFSDSSINVRPRAAPRCSRCHQTGHNKRTCMEQGESVNPSAVRNQSASFIQSSCFGKIENVIGKSDYGVCDTCRRTSTPSYDLDIRFEEPEEYNRKRYGNVDRIGIYGCYLCKECRKYFEKGSTVGFRYAWPAFVWSHLCNRHHMNNMKDFICILPTEIRQMYYYSRNEISDHLRTLFLYEEPVSLDITGRLAEFAEHMDPSKMKAPRCWDLLNKYWELDVICPMGCALHFDDKKTQKVCMIHYCNFLDENMTAFDGDRSWLIGKRPTWPEKVSVGGLFDGYAGVLIDEKIGLCFLCCSDDVHRLKGIRMIHVPRSPALLLGTNQQDPMALAVLTGNFKKAPKSSCFNVSHRVLKQSGCQAGLSTTSIHARPTGNVSLLEDQSEMAAIVLNNRSDVVEHLQTVTGHDQKRFTELYRFMHNNDGTLMERIGKCARGGTVISKDYTIDMMDGYLRRQTLQIPDGFVTADLERIALDRIEKQSAAIIAKNMRYPIFTDCARGCKPNVIWKPYFDFLTIYGSFSVGKSVVEILCNNVILLRQFLESYSKRLDEQSKSILNVVCRIVNETYIGKHSKTVKDRKRIAVLQYLENFIQACPSNGLDQDRIGYYLGHYCNGVLFYERGKYNFEEDMYDISDLDYSTVVISRSNNSSASSEDCQILLDHLEIHEFELMFIQFVDRKCDVKFLMRWSNDFAWQTDNYGYGDASRIILDQRDLAFYADQSDLLIFQRKPKNWRNIQLDIQRMTGNQNIVKCDDHNYCLIREAVGSTLLCCVGNEQCLAAVAYRCPYGFRSGIQCDIGICHKHFRGFIADGEVVCVNRSLRLAPVAQRINARAIKNRQILKIRKDVAAKRIAESNIVSRKYNDGQLFDENHNMRSAMHWVLNSFLRFRPTRAGRLVTPVDAQGLLQAITSTSPESRVPLIFPEAIIFPLIFWCEIAGSVIGALPYTSHCTAQESRAIQPWLANFAEHMAVRIRDPTLLTSQDSNYRAYAFDALVNEMSRLYSIHMVLRRGPEALYDSKYKDGVDVNVADGFFGCDNNSLGINRAVNQLAATIRAYGPWTVFVTITCNDKGTPGVKPLTERIEAVYGYNCDLYARACSSFLPMITLAMERHKQYFLAWLRSSPDEPCGPNAEIFARDEFQSQGALGNKNHVHIGLRVLEDPSVSLLRIRNTVQSMFAKDVGLDFETAYKNGYVKCHYDWVTRQEEYLRFNHHSCSDPTSRCHTNHAISEPVRKKLKRDDGIKKCRARRYISSLEYSFRTRSTIYTDEILKNMQYVELAEEKDGKLEPIVCLRGGSYSYPSYEPDGMQPTIPAIFMACRASTNVQKCDFKFTLAYLLSYELGLEERVTVAVHETKSGDMTSTSGGQENIKVGSRKRLMVLKNLNANAREIADTECVKVLLNLPYVVNDIELVHVSTVFPEDRSAIMKYHVRQKVEPQAAGLAPAMVYYIGYDEPCNQFTSSQELMIMDWFTMDYAVDNMLWCSLRPPMLRVVDSIEIFAGSFIRGALNRKKKPDDGLMNNCWIDGSNHIVKIRIGMLPFLIKWIHERRGSGTFNDSYTASQLYSLILESLEIEYYERISDKNPVYSDFFRRFVDVKAVKKTAVVFSSVSPNQGAKFMYHLLLIYGRYITEFDLCVSADFRDWFTAGNIMKMPATERDVQLLCRKYANDHLIYAPMKHMKWCSTLRAMINCIQTFFFHGDLINVGPPLVLQRSVCSVFSVELQAISDGRLMNAIRVLKSECKSVRDLPSDVLLMSDDQVLFCPIIPKKRSQSIASHDEQKKAWKVLRGVIDEYKGTTKSYVKGVILSGPPGCGKSFLLCLTALYSISCKLKVAVTALTSARAQALGAIHLHVLFGLQDRSPGNMSVKTIVQNTLLYLEKHPLVKEYLRSIEVLLIDEGGMINSQMFSAMSQILAKLNDNWDVPFGGVLVIITGDPRQLPPITGKPIWISPKMFTDFRQLVLKEYVRAEDVELQRALRLYYDNPVMSSTVADEITEIVFNGIPAHNFHTSWDTLPPGCLFIISKKVGVRKAIRAMVSDRKAKLHSWNINNPNNRRLSFESIAKDTVEKTSVYWEKGDSGVTRHLNNTVLEDESLFMYETAVMRFTCNGTTGNGVQFSQGQMCVLTKIDFSVNADVPPVTVSIVPIGVNVVDGTNVPGNWISFIVSARNTEPIFMTNTSTRVRRFQYPFVCASACTVHKAIGRTCDSVAMKFSHLNTEEGIWDSRMLYVLISRVKQIEHIHFIGKRETVKRSFHDILILPSRWSDYISKTLSKLNVLNRPLELCDCITIRNYKSPTAVGFVYAIISSKYPNLLYIGETGDFARRLSEHNSSSGGTKITNDVQYQPWLPCILITGFGLSGPHSEENIRGRKLFEKMWHTRNGNMRGLCNSIQAIRFGEEVFELFKTVERVLARELKWVNYVTIHSIPV